MPGFLILVSHPGPWEKVLDYVKDNNQKMRKGILTHPNWPYSKGPLFFCFSFFLPSPMLLHLHTKEPDPRLCKRKLWLGAVSSPHHPLPLAMTANLGPCFEVCLRREPLTKHSVQTWKQCLFLELLRLKGIDSETHTQTMLVLVMHVILCNWCLPNFLLEWQQHTTNLALL